MFAVFPGEENNPGSLGSPNRRDKRKVENSKRVARASKEVEAMSVLPIL
jgi:hypothetical protein